MTIRNEKRILRLKLSDFVSTPIQEDVLCFLDGIQKNITYKIEISCWYTDKAVSQATIKTFQVENSLEIAKLNMNFEKLNGFERFAWYDIINKEDEKLLQKFKFRIVYSTQNELLTSLVEFNNFAKSYNAGTPNEKNRNNRFIPVARQNSN